MESILVPLALFACIAYCVVGVTRLVTEARTRRRLVESGASPDLVYATLGAPPVRDPYATVRAALVLGAVGLALVVVQFLPHDSDDPLPMGIVSVAAALGLIASYAAGRRLARRDGGPERSSTPGSRTARAIAARSSPALAPPPANALLDAARALSAPAIAPAAVEPRAPAPVASAESA